MRLLFVLAALCALACAAPARAAHHALEELPVEGAFAREVANLAASYGAGSFDPATQPWDRATLARFVRDIVRRHPEAAADPLLQRLERELAPQAGVPGGWPAVLRGADEQGSLEVSPYVRADYTDDRARRAVVRDFRLGAQASFALDSTLLFFADTYAGTTSPGAHGNPADSKHFGLIEGVQLNSYFDRGYLVWAGRRGRLELGHTWLRWGSGIDGTMGLDDGARAFDVAEARVPILKRAQLEWFVALLDPNTQTYLAGHKVTVAVGNSFGFGLGELASFDGQSEVPLYLLPVVPFSHLEKRILKSSTLRGDSVDAAAKNNVLWHADAAWTARPGVRLFAELAVDDISFSSEKRPKALGWNGGFVARRVCGANAFALQAEYARVYQFTYSVFHHHDFAFGGMPTGYPLGPDVERLSARAEWRRGADWTFALEGASTRKGEGALGEYYVPGSGAVDNLPLSGVVDADARGAIAVDYAPAPGLALGVTFGAARARDLDHVAGRDANGVYGASRCTLRF